MTATNENEGLRTRDNKIAICPNCKKGLVFAFYHNFMGGDNLKCNNPKCKFWGIIRQVDIK